MLMKIIKWIWFQRLVYKLCIQFLFPPKKSFVEETLSSLVEKTMTTFVQPTLTDYILAIYIFYLWMSKGARDVFDVVVNFISSDWEVKHVTIELFEVSNISSVVMVPKLQQLLDGFSLTQKILPFVKDEGSNL